MVLKFKDAASSTKSKVILSAVALVFGVLAAIFAQSGVVFIPVISSSLLILFLVEREGRRIFSYLVPALIVIVDFVINLFYSFSCLGAVTVAIIIYVVILTGFLNKGDLSVILTVIVSALIGALAIAYALFAIKYYGDSLGFTVAGEGVSAAIDFYKQMIEQVKLQVLESFREIVAAMPEDQLNEAINEELVTMLFDTYIYGLFGAIMNIAFIIVGLTFKLFGIVSSKLLEDKGAISAWRFRLSPIYAYAYIVLVIMQIFARSGVFAIVVSSLVSVLMLMFAYIGFVSAVGIISMRIRKRALVILILAAATLLLYSISINLLAFLGVFATLMQNRVRISHDGEK